MCRADSAGRGATSGESAATDGTRSDGYHDFRRWHGFAGCSQRKLHIGWNRASDHHRISVPWRRHELDAEASHVKDHVAQRYQFCFAPVAATGRNLPELE